MKVILFSIIYISYANCLLSQQLYFPARAFNDPDEMTRNIPGLALRVTELYKKNQTDPKITYYASLFRYQMLANQYENALITIDSAKAQLNQSDTSAKVTYVYPFWLYSSTKLRARDPLDFGKTFDDIFSKSYESFSFKTADMAENYFKAELETRQQHYLEMAARLKLNKKDSISFTDAKTLCFNYLNYVVYSVEIPRVRLLLESLNDKKYIIEDSVMITLRDGSQLSATIVRIRSITIPQPVVLKFGIYPEESEVPEARFISAHGYAAVIADTRGKRLSKSEIIPFEKDASDAYDIIDWISKQPWCNGKIGMYGGSYLGFSQWAAVKTVHPALKTIVPQASVGMGIDIPGMYGIYWTDLLDWIHFVTNNKLTDRSGKGNKADWDSVRLSWYNSGKAFNALDSVEGRPNALFQRYLQHPSYDKFWTGMVPFRTEFDRINIPILTITGYYDDDQRGAMFYFDEHQKYRKASEHYLLIGPYDHGGSQGYPVDPSAVVNRYKIDPVANIKIIDIVFQWFDHILKNGPMPELLKDKINFEVMGADKWRHVSSIQKMNNDTITFFLSDSHSGTNYKLLTKPVLNGSAIEQEINLADRNSPDVDETVINGDGNIVDKILVPGNSICFISDPISQPYDINGSFIANLKMIINKKDMDISIKLYEELPDGRYFQLSNNIARCSYINDISNRQLLNPGKEEKILFTNTFFTSRHLQHGSRIVLLIGVNKNPHWEINYGTGRDVATETIRDAGENLKLQWLISGSYIKLPVWK